MRERLATDYQPGAVWRTLEEQPRFLRVLGTVAIDERMLLCDLELMEPKVWLERGTGRVYLRGRCVTTAECVQGGQQRDLPDPR